MNQSSIVNDINAAAQELVRDQPIIIPIAGTSPSYRSTRLTPTTIDYKVFSHRNHVAAVRFTFDFSDTAGGAGSEGFHHG